jgi:hypothetical protein
VVRKIRTPVVIFVVGVVFGVFLATSFTPDRTPKGERPLVSVYLDEQGEMRTRLFWSQILKLGGAKAESVPAKAVDGSAK